MDRTELSPLEYLAAAVLLGGAVLSAALWAGAALAAAAAGADLDAGLAEALRAIPGLTDRPSRPSAAWGEAWRGPAAGPVLYWAATAGVTCVWVTVAAVGVRLAGHWRRVGTEPRRRLGVDTRARFATRRELRPLIVRRPEAGRFGLGLAGRALLATENRARRSTHPLAWLRRWPHRRRLGDRGAVALIGPARCGKTVAAVSGILEWEGPAILSSVKSDLLGATIGHRSRLGEVRIFDPTASTGYASSGWSPVADAGTLSGAKRCARTLMETLVDDGTENLGMWKNLAEYLVAALAFAAHHSAGRDMTSVVEWVLTEDRPSADLSGEVAGLLEGLLGHEDQQVALDARHALNFAYMVWSKEDRTRSSVYVTAAAAVEAWADPLLGASSRTHEIDLEWLLSGPNTLYLCAPSRTRPGWRRPSPGWSTTWCARSTGARPGRAARSTTTSWWSSTRRPTPPWTSSRSTAPPWPPRGPCW